MSDLKSPLRELLRDQRSILTRGMLLALPFLVLRLLSILLFTYGLSSVLSAFLTKQQPELWSLLPLAALLRLIAETAENRLTAGMGLRAEKQIHQRLTKRLFSGTALDSARFSLAWTAGTGHIGLYMRQYIPAVVQLAVFPLIIAIISLYIDPISGLILVVCGPLTVFFLILTGTLAKKKSEQRWGELQKLRRLLLDSIQGLDSLRQMGALKRFRKRIFFAATQFRKTTMEVLKSVFLSVLSLELIATISTAIVAVQAGLRLMSGSMDYFNALFVLILTPEFFRSFRELGSARHSALDAKESAGNLYNILHGSIPAHHEDPIVSASVTNSESDSILGSESDSIRGSESGSESDPKPDSKPDSGSDPEAVLEQAAVRKSQTMNLEKVLLTEREYESQVFPWGAVLLATVVSLFSAASQAALMITSGVLITKAAAGASLAVLHIWIAGTRLFGPGRAVLRYLERLQTHSAALAVFRNLRLWLFDRLAMLPAGSLRRLHSGAVLQQLDQDMDSMDQLGPRVFFPWLSALVFTIVLPFIPPLNAICTPCLAAGLWLLLLMPLLGFIWFPAAHPPERMEMLAVEVAENQRELKTAGEKAPILQELIQTSDAYARQALKSRYRSGFLTSVQWLLLATVLAFTAVLWPAGGAHWLAAALFGLLALADLYLGLPAAVAQAVDSKAALGRILKLSDFGEEISLQSGGGVGKHDSSRQDMRRAGILTKTTAGATTGTSAETDPQIPVQIQNLSFRWPDAEHDLFSNLSMELSPGKFFALSGPVGCGKTTLIDLITGLLDTPAGYLYLFGQDASQLNAEKIAKFTACQGQRGHLFSGSIADNLLFAMPEVDHSQMEKVLEVVGLPVSQYPMEYDVGENGRLLSGGERQRLILARTLIQDKPLLILDEPFNNLDHNTQQRLLEHLKARKGRQTLLLVSHQKTGMELMDEVVNLSTFSAHE